MENSGYGTLSDVPKLSLKEDMALVGFIIFADEKPPGTVIFKIRQDFSLISTQAVIRPEQYNPSEAKWAVAGDGRLPARQSLWKDALYISLPKTTRFIWLPAKHINCKLIKIF